MKEDRDPWFDFEAMARNEKDDELTPFDQENRPHLFVRKLRRRAGGYQTITPADAKPNNLTVEEFTSLHAAAEFAAHSNMCLDLHVTLDFAKMGVFDPCEVKAALRRFVRCYSAWCADRLVPSGWISCIEMSKALTYHAHVVLFVPAGELRRHFRLWARTYAERNYGTCPSGALRVRGGRKECWMTHWILASYLAKGFDRSAILCSDRNSVDGLGVRLGDIIPWHYCDPGPVALKRRIGVSETLGPSRRQIGVAKGFESKLPRQPNWDLFAPEGKDRPYWACWTKPMPAPFRSALEDRVLDVRKLYPKEFYEFVTRLSLDHPSEADAVTCNFDDGADFLEQLRSLDC